MSLEGVHNHELIDIDNRRGYAFLPFCTLQLCLCGLKLDDL